MEISEILEKIKKDRERSKLKNKDLVSLVLRNEMGYFIHAFRNYEDLKAWVKNNSLRVTITETEKGENISIVQDDSVINEKLKSGKLLLETVSLLYGTVPTVKNPESIVSISSLLETVKEEK